MTITRDLITSCAKFTDYYDKYVHCYAKNQRISIDKYYTC